MNSNTQEAYIKKNHQHLFSLKVQPSAFESCKKQPICKLNKVLYGLKQAPRAWYERKTTTLLGFGFKASKCDPSLLILKTASHCLFILIYVDDIIITGTSMTLIQDLITKLNDIFALKPLGDLDYFLGIQVEILPNSSLLRTRSKYIGDLLLKANIHEASAVSTPLPGGCK